MDESEGSQAPVVIVLGPGIQDEVVAHTRKVLDYYGIPFLQMDWNAFEAFLAGNGARGLKVIVFETGIAYSDEHIRLPEDVVVPVVRVVTDHAPPPDQIVTGTELMGSVGYGVPGAINAGLFAARILATGDAALRDLLMTRPYPAS